MFNREIWESVSKLSYIGSYPHLPCPYCDSKSLILDKGSFSTRKLSGAALKSYVDKFGGYKDLPSIQSESSPWLSLLAGVLVAADGAMFEASQFIAFFRCSNCSESVSSMGVAKIPKNESSEIVQIKVESFNPPIPMFTLRSTTPKLINEELLRCFAYFHSDISSSGNKLRRAVEKLCEELGYNKPTLHQSIQAMANDYPQEASWLESLKFVGNEATHSDGVTESDLLNSLEIFEEVLDIFRRQKAKHKVQESIERLDKKFRKSDE